VVKNKYALLAFRLIVGGVFIWSGALKILHPLDFAQNIAAYELFPKWICLLVGLALPWVEEVTGLLLVLGLFRRGAALVASGMLAAFILLVSVTMIRGLSLTCGCFGSFSGKVGWTLLVQDVVLLFLALNVVISSLSFLALDRQKRGQD
jgi:putative oxidoreductase